MKQDTFKRMNIFFRSVFFVLLAFGISSCQKDEDEAYFVKMGTTETDVLTGDKADILIADDYVWNNTKAGEIKSFFLYSNLPDWTVQTALESDVDWIEIWPGEGSKDGRFSVKVYSNTTPEERISSLNIVHNGEVYRTIPIVQAAAN